MEERYTILDLYKSSKGIEKVLLVIGQVGACIIPFTLLASLGSVTMLYWTIGLYVVTAISLLVMNRLRNKRTGGTGKVSFIPSFFRK